MVKKLKGMRDILPNSIKMWQFVEEKARETFEKYGINEIRLPIIEKSELFLRGVGEETDIVQKEMYVFKDKSDRDVALRPELTAGVVRAYIENGMESMSSPLKLYYIGNAYRYENVQKGRDREFSQIGIEFFGSSSYETDVEVILAGINFFKNLNITDFTLKINSIGSTESRKNYIEKLKNYVEPNLNEYCKDCQTRFEKNALRLLDCKQEKCKKLNENAPKITDYLDTESREDFENLKKALTDLEIRYEIDTNLVRGLDYYNKTVFEFVSNKYNIALGGGGRYDKLVSSLGGKETPAVGFGIGELRLIELCISEQENQEFEEKLDLFIANIGENTKIEAIKLAEKLRSKGFKVETDLMNRSLKSQLKYADKKNARYSTTIGENELLSKKIQIKNMENGDIKQVDIDKIENEIC